MTTETTHLEVLAAIESKGRSYWTRIGVAFKTKDGEGFRLKLNFIPTNPATEILVMPPKPREGEER